MTSDRVEMLDVNAEVFYRRLMSKVDDHGLFDARTSYLRASLFPLRVDRVREADIPRWIAICEKAGLIALYAIDGKPFGQMLDTNWEARSKPKYRLPPWGAGTFANVNSWKRLQTSVPLVVDVVVVEDVVSTLVDPPAADQTPQNGKPAINGKVNGKHALGSRLPADWRIPDPYKAWALSAYPDLTPEKVVLLSLEFRDYWAALPGQRGRKTDWLATWRNNVRKKMGDA